MNEASFFRVSIKALVKDDQGRILLTRESDGKWDMLGGGLDHGEEPHEGLAREVFEEAGLKIAYMSDAPVHFLTVFNPRRNIYLANVVYEAKLQDLDFVRSEECEELRFVSVAEAATLDLNPNIQKLLTLL